MHCGHYYNYRQLQLHPICPTPTQQTNYSYNYYYMRPAGHALILLQTLLQLQTITTDNYNYTRSAAQVHINKLQRYYTRADVYRAGCAAILQQALLLQLQTTTTIMMLCM